MPVTISRRGILLSVAGLLLASPRPSQIRAGKEVIVIHFEPGEVLNMTVDLTTQQAVDFQLAKQKCDRLFALVDFRDGRPPRVVRGG